MTDYERGRLAGFAEGVEAAAKACEAVSARWEERANRVGNYGRRKAAKAIRALRAPSPKEDAPVLIKIAWLADGSGTFAGRCPCGSVWSAVRISEIDGINDAHARRCSGPRSIVIPAEAPGNEDDLPESKLCSRCHGEGLEPYATGYVNCLRCYGTGRSTTGGGR